MGAWAKLARMQVASEERHKHREQQCKERRRKSLREGAGSGERGGGSGCSPAFHKAGTDGDVSIGSKEQGHCQALLERLSWGSGGREGLRGRRGSQTTSGPAFPQRGHGCEGEGDSSRGD